MTLYALWGPGSSTGNSWTYINTPENLNNEKYLADKSKGNKLLYKKAFTGTTEIYYSHKLSAPLKGKVYYAMRFFNANDDAVTLKINGCGAVVGDDASKVWKSYYDKTCNIGAMEYSIPSKGGIIIFQNGDSFVIRTDKDQSGITALDGNFEGVINMTSSGELLVANLLFYNIVNTYEAAY
jgi:hypothetical protein